MVVQVAVEWNNRDREMNREEGNRADDELQVLTFAYEHNHAHKRHLAELFSDFKEVKAMPVVVWDNSADL